MSKNSSKLEITGEIIKAIYFTSCRRILPTGLIRNLVPSQGAFILFRPNINSALLPLCKPSFPGGAVIYEKLAATEVRFWSISISRILRDSVVENGIPPVWGHWGPIVLNNRTFWTISGWFLLGTTYVHSRSHNLFAPKRRIYCSTQTCLIFLDSPWLQQHFKYHLFLVGAIFILQYYNGNLGSVVLEHPGGRKPLHSHPYPRPVMMPPINGVWIPRIKSCSHRLDWGIDIPSIISSSNLLD